MRKGTLAQCSLFGSGRDEPVSSSGERASLDSHIFGLLRASSKEILIRMHGGTQSTVREISVG